VGGTRIRHGRSSFWCHANPGSQGNIGASFAGPKFERTTVACDATVVRDAAVHSAPSFFFMAATAESGMSKGHSSSVATAVFARARAAFRLPDSARAWARRALRSGRGPMTAYNAASFFFNVAIAASVRSKRHVLAIAAMAGLASARASSRFPISASAWARRAFRSGNG